MACNPVVEQSVLLLGASADIVDDQRPAVFIPAIRDNEDVRQGVAHETDDDVAGQIVRRFPGDGHGPALPFEESHQIGHTAVVDVSVGAFQPPDFRVLAEIPLHIFMHSLLQVESIEAECSDDDVGAHAAAGGHVAHGVIELHVGWIVSDGDAYLPAGERGEACIAHAVCSSAQGGRRKRREQQRGERPLLHALDLGGRYRQDIQAAKALVPAEQGEHIPEVGACVRADESHAHGKHDGAGLDSMFLRPRFHAVGRCVAVEHWKSLEIAAEGIKQLLRVGLKLRNHFRIILDCVEKAEMGGNLRKQLHFLLQRGESRAQLRSVPQTRRETEGQGGASEFIPGQCKNVLLVHPFALGYIEFGGRTVHGLEAEVPDELFLAEQFGIVFRVPSQQGDEIHDGSREKSFLRIGTQGGSGVTLRHFRAVRVLDEGNVGVDRRRLPESLEELQVLERVHDVIFASNHVRDLHLDVIHHVDEVKDIRAVGAAHHHVGGIFLVGVVHRDVSADEIVQRHGVLPFEAEAPYRALGRPGYVVAVLVFAIGSGRFVHASRRQEPFKVAVINLFAPALEIGAVVPPRSGTFVPVETEPFQPVKNGLSGGFDVAFLVGVFDAQYERAAHLTGKKPIEQSRAGAADVQVTGRRRGETGAYG